MPRSHRVRVWIPHWFYLEFIEKQGRDLGTWVRNALALWYYLYTSDRVFVEKDGGKAEVILP